MTDTDWLFDFVWFGVPLFAFALFFLLYPGRYDPPEFISVARPVGVILLLAAVAFSVWSLRRASEEYRLAREEERHEQYMDRLRRQREVQDYASPPRRGVCQYCNGVLPSGAQRCPNCGAPV